MENEYVEQPSVMKIAFKWGVITGIVLILVGFALQFSGLAAESWSGYINLIPVIIFMVLAHNDFKNSGDGFMSYGQALGIGTLVAVFSGVISSIFSYIYLVFVDDSMLQQIKDRSYEQWVESGMSDAAIEQSEKFMEVMMSPGLFTLIGVLVIAFFGFIIALIVSAITKNSRPEF